MARKLLVFFSFVTAIFIAGGSLPAYGISTIVNLARTYDVFEESVEFGDIIARQTNPEIYRLAKLGDTDIVGVVVRDPLLLLDVIENGVPIAENGEVLVNVATLNGAITAGDLITVSVIPGKGMKARDGDLVVGIAKEDFSSDDAIIMMDHNGEEVSIGTIPVQLNVGFGNLLPVITKGNTNNLVNTGLITSNGRVLDILKYTMALLVAVGSLYVSFRGFGVNIKNSIVSIGRNPLAKTSIQAMVVLNVFLILLVGGGGLFLSIVILLLPI